MRIDSKENSRVKRICKLTQSSRFRKENGLFVLDGLRLCADAVKNGYPLLETYYTSTFESNFAVEAGEIISSSREHFEVSDAVMKKMSDTESPQGVICVCEMPAEKALSFKKGCCYVALDGVADPSNIGAISRTAEALGVSHILVFGGCDPYSPKALRSSMGALLRIPVTVCGQLSATLEKAKSAGLPVFASVVKNADMPVTSADFSFGGVMIVGNEANGVSSEAVAAASSTVTIPMNGRAESLNAAAAAAILIYEMCKKQGADS